MRNQNLYRSAGVCGLLSIVLMLAELPLYVLRGPMPSRETASLIGYATHNAWNMLAAVLMDVVICALLLIFLDGFRRLIGNTQPDSMWIATQVFGAGVVYSAVTLFGDALQAASAMNALSAKPDPSFLRVFLQGRYPFFGTVGLLFCALLLAAGSHIAQASRAFPRATIWIGYTGACLCLALVPFVMANGPQQFLAIANSAPWDALAAIAILAVVVWMITVVIQMIRQHEPQPSGR
jgi:hypothetical protein